MHRLVNTLQFRIAILLCLTVISCNNPNLNIIGPATYPDLQEHKLGESEYFIRLPKTMFLDEARGKEGQLGYGVYLRDTSRRYKGSSGFIEIEHGRPIGGGLLDGEDKLVNTVKSPILGKNVKWKIYLNESGYFFSIAKRDGMLLTASSRTHEGIDSMISIISTLKER